MKKQDLIKYLSLVEHTEGGYFVESYRSQDNISTNRPGSDRSILTSIYYLLTDDRSVDYWYRFLPSASFLFTLQILLVIFGSEPIFFSWLNFCDDISFISTRSL